MEATGSAAAMGTVLIFSSVPMLIFLLIGGVTVDRFSRSKIMFASEAVPIRREIASRKKRAVIELVEMRKNIPPCCVFASRIFSYLFFADLLILA